MFRSFFILILLAFTLGLTGCDTLSGVSRSEQFWNVCLQYEDGLHRQFTTLLNDPRIDINFKNAKKSQTTPLMALMQSENPIVALEILLKNDLLEINAIDNKGGSALFYLLTNKKMSPEIRAKTLQKLLSHPNLQINLASYQGWNGNTEEQTPLMLADPASFEILTKDSRTNPNFQTPAGRGALHQAAITNDYEKLERLMKFPRTNLLLMDQHGHTTRWYLEHQKTATADASALPVDEGRVRSILAQLPKDPKEAPLPVEKPLKPAHP